MATNTMAKKRVGFQVLDSVQPAAKKVKEEESVFEAARRRHETRQNQGGKSRLRSTFLEPASSEATPAPASSSDAPESHDAWEQR